MKGQEAARKKEMSITNAQKVELAKIGEVLCRIFPDTYGNIRFNLHPQRKDVNVNYTIEESLIIKKTD